MIGHWKTTLSMNAAEWNLPVGGEWNFLLHNNYQPTCSSFNVLWFYQGERFPRAVAKVCRREDVLRHEFESLEAVYRIAPGHVPKPLSIGFAGGFWIFWMTGVPGLRVPPLGNYPRKDLSSIVDMLVSIHQAVGKDSAEYRGNRHRKMVTEPLRALAHFGSSEAVLAGCLTLAETSSPLWINTLPIIPQHGDLFLDNVLRYQDQWHVVDWETFGAVDLPFYDLFTLLLSMLRSSGERPQQWNPKLVNHVPSLVARYAFGLDLPVPLVSTLLPLTLANWFYLHWLEGRKTILEEMYRSIQLYFEDIHAWNAVFLGATVPL